MLLLSMLVFLMRKSLEPLSISLRLAMPRSYCLVFNERNECNTKSTIAYLREPQHIGKCKVLLDLSTDRYEDSSVDSMLSRCRMSLDRRHETHGLYVERNIC